MTMVHRQGILCIKKGRGEVCGEVVGTCRELVLEKGALEKQIPRGLHVQMYVHVVPGDCGRLWTLRSEMQWCMCRYKKRNQ